MKALSCYISGLALIPLAALGQEGNLGKPVGVASTSWQGLQGGVVGSLQGGTLSKLSKKGASLQNKSWEALAGVYGQYDGIIGPITAGVRLSFMGRLHTWKGDSTLMRSVSDLAKEAVPAASSGSEAREAYVKNLQTVAKEIRDGSVPSEFKKELAHPKQLCEAGSAEFSPLKTLHRSAVRKGEAWVKEIRKLEQEAAGILAGSAAVGSYDRELATAAPVIPSVAGFNTEVVAKGLTYKMPEINKALNADKITQLKTALQAIVAPAGNVGGIDAAGIKSLLDPVADYLDMTIRGGGPDQIFDCSMVLQPLAVAMSTACDSGLALANLQSSLKFLTGYRVTDNPPNVDVVRRLVERVNYLVDSGAFVRPGVPGLVAGEKISQANIAGVWKEAVEGYTQRYGQELEKALGEKVIQDLVGANKSLSDKVQAALSSLSVQRFAEIMQTQAPTTSLSSDELITALNTAKTEALKRLMEEARKALGEAAAAELEALAAKGLTSGEGVVDEAPEALEEEKPSAKKTPALYSYRWIADAAARVGYPMGFMQPYVEAGFSLAGVTRTKEGKADESRTLPGFKLGLGTAMMFKKHYRAEVGYTYHSHCGSGKPDATKGSGYGKKWALSRHGVVLSLGYKF